MPEGDTIWRTAAALRQRVGGRVAAGASPAAFERLRGRTLEAVEPVGKHLLMRFSGGWTLHSHLRMSGSWHLYRPGERWRRPEHLARVVLDFGEWQAVCFSAPVLELVRDEASRVGHLGPDILADDFPLAGVVARARAAGPQQLAELLLDQRVCCGIGNVYKCETLWQLRLSPWRSSAELDDRQLGELFAAAREHMRANLGTWARRFSGRPGAVHGRGGRPCPRCGSPVRVRRQGEHARYTYWCAVCQPDEGQAPATALTS
jgi:endonuclease-8